MTDRSVLAYVDSQGDLRCVSGAGLMAISDEGFKALTELQGHLELAIACRETLGGIPISVKQACCMTWRSRLPAKGRPTDGYRHNSMQRLRADEA